MDQNFHKIASTIRQIFVTHTEANELMIQGKKSVFLLKGHNWLPFELTEFCNDKTLREFCFQLAEHCQRRLDVRHPYQGGLLSPSLRWHALIPPALPKCAKYCLQIRRIRSAQQLAYPQKTPRDFFDLLASALRANVPLVIYGDTGSGKTTLLNTILKFNCIEERLIIIESIDEISLQSRLWTKLLTREPDVEGFGSITMQTLFAQSLRLNPDRIVIGELRTEDAKIFNEVLLAGHGSTITTIHAHNDDAALQRLRKYTDPRIKGRVCLISMVSANEVDSITFYDRKSF